MVSTIAVNNRAPDKSLSIEFLLHSPHNIVPLSPATGLSTPATTDKPLVATSPRIVADLNFTLGNFIDNNFAELGADEIYTLFANTRNTLSLLFSHQFYLITVTRPAPTSIPKIDHVHSVTFPSDITTFTGYLDFSKSQSSFHFVFGSNPTILRKKHASRVQTTHFL